MLVKEAMHQGVQWVEPSTLVHEIARLMRDHDIGAIPIGENDRLIGMVTDRDLVCRGLAQGGDANKLTARDVMSKGIVYCNENADLGEAARLMQVNKIRRMPVINSAKRMVGMLAIGDLTHASPRTLASEVMTAVSEHHH
jgi:CBS domain-containing protein